MNMKMKLKKRSRRYDINNPTSRHGRKYSKYITCLTMMMLMKFITHLSNSDDESKKSVAYKKSV